MRFTRKFLGVFLLLLPLLLTNTTNAFEFDEEETAQVTARVARINIIRGDVQIRHADSEDWERATLNLPVVEGDEITTSPGARLEIQFDRYNYLRLSEDSYLKITTLRDEGIAVSLPQGTMSVRAMEFDKDKTFFEIDAPKTTIAVQQAGMYRIDAGDSRSTEIRVTVTEDGQARVYSENNGATLRAGRSMRIYLDGNYAGEWETADASRYADDFDSWTLERDAIIAKRLRDNYNNNYYDRDIYGADDLSENGEWIYTKKYGYVWKPYRNATAQYADWSPYRYGHWRWIPPYGWTWINDEPWGWATYHHGRWIYVDNDWCWTPYAAYRARRSWWRPALVVVSYYGSLICWYPLPYHYGYYNYNNITIIRNTTIINNTTVVVSPTPNTDRMPQQADPNKKLGDQLPSIPPKGVVVVDASEFGRDRKGFKTAPTDVAQQVLSKIPDRNSMVLPTIKQLNGKLSREIIAETPKIARVESKIKTGVTDRTIGVSMNEKLQKERVLDNRENSNTQIRNSANPTTKTEVRDTGALKRQTNADKQESSDSNTPVKPTRDTRTEENKIRSTGGGKTDRNENPVKVPRNDNPVKPSQNDRENNQTVRPPVRMPLPPPRNDDKPTKQPSQPTKQPSQPSQDKQKKEAPKEEQKPPSQKRTKDADG